MRKTVFGVALVLLLAACSYKFGYSFTYDEHANLVALELDMGIDPDMLREVAEMAGEDMGEEDQIIRGLLFPDQVSDDEFAAAVQGEPGGFLSGSISDDPDATVDIERRVGDDGYSYVTVTATSTGQGLEGVPFDGFPTAAVNNDGSVLIETTIHRTGGVNEELFDSADFGTGDGGDDLGMFAAMFDVSHTLSITGPYPVADTNGTPGDDENTATWAWDLGDEDALPDTLYVLTEPPPTDLPVLWIAVGAGVLVLLGIVVFARKRSRVSRGGHAP